MRTGLNLAFPAPRKAVWLSARVLGLSGTVTFTVAPFPRLGGAAPLRPGGAGGWLLVPGRWGLGASEGCPIQSPRPVGTGLCSPASEVPPSGPGLLWPEGELPTPPAAWAAGPAVSSAWSFTLRPRVTPVPFPRPPCLSWAAPGPRCGGQRTAPLGTGSVPADQESALFPEQSASSSPVGLCWAWNRAGVGVGWDQKPFLARSSRI